jgi:Arc/MetJ family transcription regulator
VRNPSRFAPVLSQDIVDTCRQDIVHRPAFAECLAVARQCASNGLIEMYVLSASKRITIEMDEQLLAAAQAVLGGLKETVDRALTEVVRAFRRRALADRLGSGKGLDLDDETTRAARHWRTAQSS